MLSSHTDLRIVRTKGAIWDALTELIEEKGFEFISVKDITTRAKINRGTFYLHYRDKYDLMEKCRNEILHEIKKIVQQNIPCDLKSITIPFPGTVYVFEYINEFGGFINALLGPKGDLSFQTELKSLVWDLLFENNLNQLIKREDLLVPDECLVSYMASANLGVIQQWLQDGRKRSPMEMARILSTLSFNGPLYAAGLKK
ncbi:TetR/AcrR family transcriptional regulator [Bacillus pseudomycoides]|uniref:TetR family transcriptional regulator n=1 Tax=Bacillus pseudomycoides TaxID=64104 RepID=A0A2B6JDG7_9BACI|nr:TetR/AcrR family transcriptional regulator C-terminal domain-containing protein [Bacillus pseudomycoides]PED69389.1 TetR family transcriptional regulator [Bacillus pseudomycoides]PEI31314.1 TetR family transcriptional regulator [Bacillus pseudomycoides]PEJ70566.1 TetR family transcriptional regulator [Bacillus pseudomycoides]PEM08333.1 TetR family transcriptional regulator [Bacillus pseudomycoides]PEM66398.1 TetR family transcriptional regulator [Bacillus pseudomycoides]